MAASTIVVTYTAGSAGSADDLPTSLTVGGTAYASLTAANVIEAVTIMEAALKMLRAAGPQGDTLSAAGKAQMAAGIKTLSTK